MRDNLRKLLFIVTDTVTDFALSANMAGRTRCEITKGNKALTRMQNASEVRMAGLPLGVGW